MSREAPPSEPARMPADCIVCLHRPPAGPMPPFPGCSLSQLLHSAPDSTPTGGCRMLIDDMHEHVYKRWGDLAAEGGLTLAELRAAQVSNMPKNRGKNI